MFYRVRLDGTITLYSEEALERITKLAEDDELFSYLSTLLNTGSETHELMKRLDDLLANSVRLVKENQINMNSPLIDSPLKTAEVSERKAESVSSSKQAAVPSGKGSAAKMLERKRKVNKKI